MKFGIDIILFFWEECLFKLNYRWETSFCLDHFGSGNAYFKNDPLCRKKSGIKGRSPYQLIHQIIVDLIPPKLLLSCLGYFLFCFDKKNLKVKMRFFFIMAMVVAVCSATTLFTGKNIKVNDDGTIYITGEHGKQVTIRRPNGHNGIKDIDIMVNTPNAPVKHIQITDTGVYDNVLLHAGEGPNAYGDDEELRLKRASWMKRDKYPATSGGAPLNSQSEILAEIFQQHTGILDDVTYEKLLKRIYKAVQKGEVNPAIYDLLQASFATATGTNNVANEYYSMPNTIGAAHQMFNLAPNSSPYYYWNKKYFNSYYPESAADYHYYYYNPLVGARDLYAKSSYPGYYLGNNEDEVAGEHAYSYYYNPFFHGFGGKQHFVPEKSPFYYYPKVSTSHYNTFGGQKVVPSTGFEQSMLLKNMQGEVTSAEVLADVVPSKYFYNKGFGGYVPSGYYNSQAQQQQALPSMGTAKYFYNNYYGGRVTPPQIVY